MEETEEWQLAPSDRIFSSPRNMKKKENMKEKWRKYEGIMNKIWRNYEDIWRKYEETWRKYKGNMKNYEEIWRIYERGIFFGTRHLPEEIPPKTQCPKTIYPKKISRNHYARTSFTPKKIARNQIPDLQCTRITFCPKNNFAGRVGLNQAKDCISSENSAGRVGIGKNSSRFDCISSKNSAGRVGLSQVRFGNREISPNLVVSVAKILQRGLGLEKFFQIWLY